MFEGFSAPRDGAAGKRLAASAGASLLVWILAGAALALAGASAAPEVKKRVSVVFRPPPPPPVEAAPPPPPPPQPPAQRRPPPPKTLATREVAELPPPAPLVAPIDVPLEKPAEAEPTGEPIAVASAGPLGHGYGAPAAPPSPGPGPRAAEPIHLPENAAPPVPAANNPQPEYPLEARARGLGGTVVLRIVIDERGAVARVEVLRGDEPFASAAVSAVRRWRYEPARLDGAPVSHFRIVRVPFRIQNG